MREETFKSGKTEWFFFFKCPSLKIKLKIWKIIILFVNVLKLLTTLNKLNNCLNIKLYSLRFKNFISYCIALLEMVFPFAVPKQVSEAAIRF